MDVLTGYPTEFEGYTNTGMKMIVYFTWNFKGGRSKTHNTGE